MYFPDDNSEKYPGILYPGDMTENRGNQRTGYISDANKIEFLSDLIYFSCTMILILVGQH